MAPSPSTHGVTLHRGCPLHYDSSGHGPAVLFIQGVGVHGDGWLPQTEALSSEFQCVRYDNRGMGQSLPRGPKLTIESMAEDALHLLDTLGIASAHVVGHSVGGLVAQEVALRARARVKTLSLLCTFSQGKDATRLSWDLLWIGTRTRVGPRSARRRAFLRLISPPAQLAGKDSASLDALAGELQPLFGHDLADSPSIAMEQLSAARAYDARPRLPSLAGLPTLCVGARFDPIARPATMKELAARIPGARLVELEDASHGVPIEQPARVNGLLREHFALG